MSTGHSVSDSSEEDEEASETTCLIMSGMATGGGDGTVPLQTAMEVDNSAASSPQHRGDRAVRRAPRTQVSATILYTHIYIYLYIYIYI